MSHKNNSLEQLVNVTSSHSGGRNMIQMAAGTTHTVDMFSANAHNKVAANWYAVNRFD
jgi:hypothetical protein